MMERFYGYYTGYTEVNDGSQGIATTVGLCFVGAVNLDQLGIQAVDGVIYLLVCENTFFPMYATLALIPQELPLLLREYKAGMYSVYLYYLARMISLVSSIPHSIYF